MQLLLAPQITKRLQRELRRAGRREIGGLLMGEHLGGQVFRVVDISVQRSGGSQVCFVRDPKGHQAHLEAFFARTGGDYSRFNYLGEWHSHPSFEAVPSATDIETMQSIVSDAAVGVNFLVLLIVKLATGRKIESAATAFRAYSHPISISVSAEPDAQGSSIASQWLQKIFRS